MKQLLSIIALLGAACGQTYPFPGPNSPYPHSTGPTYQYIAAESGSCSATAASCTITLSTVNGDVLVTNCVVSGTVTPFCGGWSDINGETWNDDVDYSASFTIGASGGTAVIQNGGSGDVITCLGSSHGTSIFCSITAYRSSTGWSGGGGGDPIDTASPNYVLASNAGPCTVTASGATSQANELVVGGCVTSAGTPSSATGYSAANSGSISATGFSQFWNGYKGVTSTGTYSFTTNGTLTTPLSLIMTLMPN